MARGSATEVDAPPPAMPTRERIVRSAARLFRAKGVTGTGTLEILSDANAPRGSMYHHFPGGKPQLVEEALRFESTRVAQDLQRLIDTGADTPTVLVQFAEALAASLELSDFQLGCPVTTAALELSTDDAAVQAVCAEAYRTWQNTLESLLAERAGIRERPASSFDAELILAAIEGGLVLARAHRDGNVVRRIARQLAESYNPG